MRFYFSKRLWRRPVAERTAKRPWVKRSRVVDQEGRVSFLTTLLRVLAHWSC